jgi:hypothetical protein
VARVARLARFVGRPRVFFGPAIIGINGGEGVFFPPDGDGGEFDPEEDPGIGVFVDPEMELPEGTTIDPRVPYEAPAEDEEGNPIGYKYCRFLRVTNETDDTVTVFLKYRAKDPDSGDWVWVPSSPEDDPDDALTYDLEPGETIDLTDPDAENERICTTGIRFWAESDDTEYTIWKDRTLWVVPKDASRQRRYRSPVVQTFEFSIR